MMDYNIQKHFKNHYRIIIIGVIAISLIANSIFDDHTICNSTSSYLFSVIGSIFSSLVMWLGVMSIVRFLWIKFPWDTNPIKHLIIEALSILFYTTLVGSIYFIINYFYPIEGFDESIKLSVFFTLIITFFITSLYEGYFFFINWKETRILSEKLAKENIQSQYETLKSQINPHFLFNNLNTLSALIEENPKLAVEYVQKTADYYRSILNLKDKEVITLGEELDLINTFFNLQHNRYGDNLKLIVDIDSSFYSTYVAPLSLQMLLENAIKHNIISKDKPLTVSVTSTTDYISVSNNLQKRDVDQESNGFGLKNITDRYSYLSSRKVEISENDSYFTVSIPILTM